MLGQTRRNHTRDAHLGCSHSPLFPVALDKTVKIEKYEVDATRAPTRAPPADAEVCWICLEGNTNEKADLIRPCKCPRVVHARCMARWQLQCSGKDEEVHCKFCYQDLPNWRETLFRDVMDDDTKEDSRRASSNATAEQQPKPAPDSVNGDIIVKFNNMSFRCRVRTGQEGLDDFMKQIREKCKIPEDKMNCLNLTYRCKDPNTGTQMTLEGVNNSAFDAAVLCSAVQDKLKQRKSSKHSKTSNPGKMSSFFSRSSTSSSSSSSSSGRDVSPEPERRSGGMFHRPRRVSAPPPETESSQNRRSNMFGAPENETSRERDQTRRRSNRFMPSFMSSFVSL